MARRLVPALVAVAALTVSATPQPTSQPAPPPGQPPAASSQSEVKLTITGDPGVPPRYAVPDFIALSPDAETQAIARTISEVLWADLEFEREFYLIPRDTYRSIPPARSLDDVPFDRWRELGADGLVAGTVQKTSGGLVVQFRLYRVRDRQVAFPTKEYVGAAANPRFFAHTISDEIHHQQSGLRGVARTKIAYSSDRDGERALGTVEKRAVKEIYVSDYDGVRAQRVTINRVLNITPSWAPDGRALAYTSYKQNRPDIWISLIYQGTMENPTGGRFDNFLPAFSPDGTRIAFMSNRDGNPEIYVMNRDGSNVRRLTNHPANDVSATWSPTGAQIAFTSDRSGSPQIYIVGADSLNLRKITSEAYCDRPAWSPDPRYNEIAYASRSGPGFDIRILDLATNERRSITFGEGSNESPSWAPNGRHLAFMSTRRGKSHVFTIARDGKDLRQVTDRGNNFTPDWSK